MDMFGSVSSGNPQPQIMFRTLRRLHGHNLENSGLNNLTEAFQSFMTRTKFFSIGRMRRTWSHSAVEFLKYRRLLPMLVSDEHSSGVAMDDFDPFDQPSFSAARPEDKRIKVSNVSTRATKSQIQAFFTKFGKISGLESIESASGFVESEQFQEKSCQLASEDKRQTMYATMSKHKKKFCTFYITFAKEADAIQAKRATPDELIFYGQQMVVSSFAPSSGRRRMTPAQEDGSDRMGLSIDGDDAISLFASASSPLSGGPEFGKLSRSLSMQSVLSSGIISSATAATALPLDELPTRVLEHVFEHLEPIDRVRLERVNKKWLEAAARAWASADHLRLGGRCFSAANPLRNAHLRAFLQRCGRRLVTLDLSGAVNLLDDAAVEAIGRQCLNLVELDLSGVVASPNALRSLSESLQQLRRVAYRGATTADERHFWSLFCANGASIVAVDLRGCARLRGRCFKLFGSALEKVLLDDCRKIDGEVVEDFCLHSNGLKILSLNGCTKLTDESLSLISRNLLDLCQFHFNGDGAGVTLEGLLQLCRLPSLRHLSLDHQSSVSDEFLVALADGVPTLRSLSIAFAGSDATVSREAILRLADLRDLVKLDVSGIAAVDSTLFRALSDNCPRLANLTARSCTYLSDDGVEALTTGLAGVSGTLQRVDLSGCIMGRPNGLSFVSLVVGGTICEHSHVRPPPNCRVQLDFSDYSALNLSAAKDVLVPHAITADESDEKMSDDILGDEFVLLSAYRSLVSDALDVECDSPAFENDKEILEWAHREASQLGLLTDEPARSP